MTIGTISRLVLVMLLWAVCYPLITAGIAYAPPLSFATVRAVVAGASLILIALLLRRPAPRGVGTWAMLAVSGVGATSLGFFAMFYAAGLVSPGIATVIANSQPLLAAVLARIFLGERLAPRGRAGLLLGFIGIVVIASPQLFAGEPRHALSERRPVRVTVQEAKRRRRRLEFAVGMIEQHLGQAFAGDIQPGIGCRRVEKLGYRRRDLRVYSHSSISVADCSRSSGDFASIMFSSAWYCAKRVGSNGNGALPCR